MAKYLGNFAVLLALVFVGFLLFAAPLTGQGRLALVVTTAVFLGLQRRGGAIEVLFIGGLVLVTLFGILRPEHAFAGFASKAVLTIGALFIAATGLRTTGVLDWLGEKLLGSAKTEQSALRRLALVTPISAVVLNTPLVAMLAPVVVDWCRSRNISPSRLLIPLSYLAIIGGVCTLIGTTTTLVINGLLTRYEGSEDYAPEILAQLAELSFFEISYVGVPCALVGLLYMMKIAPKLLPKRVGIIEQLGQERREYLVEMLVQPTCPLIGKSVEQAGLRQLPGLFLIEIDREGEVIAPVTPQDTIQSHDRMVFTGLVTTIVDLERIPGLVPAADITYEFQPAQRSKRHLTEVVLSRNSPLIGRTVRAANFRKRYNAAVVAVHRAGERLPNKIGDIRLEPGDTLLLQTRDDFVDLHRNNKAFYLVSAVGGSPARRHDRAWIAGTLFVLLIIWLMACSLLPALAPQLAARCGNLFTTQSYALAAMTIAVAMIVTRCLNIAEARAAIDLQVLITIAAAIGLGEALSASGAAQAIAEMLIQMVSAVCIESVRPYVLLIVVYFMAMVCTEMITNIAVAALMIPIAIGVAIVGSYDPRPFIIAITMASSLSFITPIGYQTNLMVMGPGGYHPKDFAKVGLPLALLMAITSLVIIPIVWPF